MRTGRNTTSSRPRWTRPGPTAWSPNTRCWSALWWPRLRRRPKRSSKRKLHLGAGVAHLVERNLPKVEVASSRLVSRSISGSLRSPSWIGRRARLVEYLAPKAPVALHLRLAAFSHLPAMRGGRRAAPGGAAQFSQSAQRFSITRVLPVHSEQLRG